VVGLGGKMQGIPREGGFDITAASEIMAILCLARDMKDLEKRINSILIAYKRDGSPIYAKEVGVAGAMMALLRDAMHPNLVQAFEGTPAFVHGGPFANIAHGCNSIIATKMAMHHAEYTITEAGFGFDLGAEKFFDIKCRIAEIDPDVVVLVTTIRALKLHGGKDKTDLETPDAYSVTKGLVNLEKHIESVEKFSKHPVVALNQFAADSEEEIAIVKSFCESRNVSFAVSSHHANGGKGAMELAKAVIAAVDKSEPYVPLYSLDMSVADKVRAVCQEMYGADDVSFTKEAEKDLLHIKQLNLESLPICIAKAPSSLSDDPSLHGRPKDFSVTVRAIQINAGAGFLVILTGNIMRMPGLPKVPQANNYGLAEDGSIIGMS
jgi:formate--tetrahydrofolate ligase